MPEDTSEEMVQPVLKKEPGLSLLKAVRLVKSLAAKGPEGQKSQASFIKSFDLGLKDYHPGTIFREEWIDRQGQTRYSWWVIGERNEQHITLYQAVYLLKKLRPKEVIGEFLDRRVDLATLEVKMATLKHLYDFKGEDGTLMDVCLQSNNLSPKSPLGKTVKIDLIQRASQERLDRPGLSHLRPQMSDLPAADFR